MPNTEKRFLSRTPRQGQGGKKRWPRAGVRLFGLEFLCLSDGLHLKNLSDEGRLRGELSHGCSSCDTTQPRYQQETRYLGSTQ